MQFLNSFNRFTGKWMPAIVLLCICMGIIFCDPIGRLLFLVPYVFAFMAFSGALNSSFRNLGDIARHPLPLLVSLVIIHAVIPLLALTAGRLMFPGHPYFITGTVLEYVVPSAVASVLWCVMAGGSISLTLTILIVDTFTAPLLIPFSLRLLIGSDVQVDVMGMMQDLLWMVTVPALFAMLLNQFTRDRAGKKLSPVLSPFGRLALIFIITVNSTRIAPFVRHMTLTQAGVAGMILFLAITGYALGWLSAFLLRQDAGITASMTFACGMRNISAGAVIAAAYFPAEVMFPVMAGTLFQQALASIFSHLLAKRCKARNEDLKSDAEK
jgi:predicted Na+-dependent transporter